MCVLEGEVSTRLVGGGCYTLLWFSGDNDAWGRFGQWDDRGVGRGGDYVRVSACLWRRDVVFWRKGEGGCRISVE